MVHVWIVMSIYASYGYYFVALSIVLCNTSRHFTSYLSKFHFAIIMLWCVTYDINRLLWVGLDLLMARRRDNCRCRHGHIWTDKTHVIFLCTWVSFFLQICMFPHPKSHIPYTAGEETLCVWWTWKPSQFTSKGVCD